MINIQTVTVADIPEVLAFVLAARAELFPKLSDTSMPADLRNSRPLTFTAMGTS